MESLGFSAEKKGGGGGGGREEILISAPAGTDGGEGVTSERSA